MADTPKIIVYTKPFCPWTKGVLDLLNGLSLPFEERDVIKNGEYFREMREKTGQDAAPCVDFDGHMLVDVGEEEVRAWLAERGLLRK